MDQPVEVERDRSARCQIGAELLTAGMLPGLEDALLRFVAKDTEALQLLRSYIVVLKGNDAPATLELRQLVVGHLDDLVALVLGATPEAAEVGKVRGVRGARLQTIKFDVLSQLADPDLNIRVVAARHGVTPRTVQKLFESEGTTFSQFLLDQRIALAHRMLSDSRHADLSISSIAFDAGFGDLSHFNRAFRRRYGQAPSGVRAAAAGKSKI